MNLQETIEKIMSDEILRAELGSKSSLRMDEIYNFFRENGFDGKQKELKNRLFKKAKSIQKVNEGELEPVSGGVSGKAILSVCAGIIW